MTALDNAFKVPLEDYSPVERLAEFTKRMWPVIEPGRILEWNWHLDIICEELELVMAGKVRELVICMPPGMMKSIIVSVMLPAWRWLHRPSERSVYLSNKDQLAIRDSGRTRDIVRSLEYQRLIRSANAVIGTPLWEIKKGQDEKHLFANTQHGFREALSLGADVTGERGDGIVLDDPYDVSDVLQGSRELVADRMQAIINQYDHRLNSRLNDPRSGYHIVVMQRVHTMDLAGVLFDRGVRCVVLPMEFDPDRNDVHPKDPRRRKGQLLFPSFFTAEKVAREKAKPLASLHWNAQYNQMPLDDEGGMFQKPWFRYYREQHGGFHSLHDDNIVMRHRCWLFACADTATDEKKWNDYSVIGVWAVESLSKHWYARHLRQQEGEQDQDDLIPNMYLLDVWRAKVQMPDLEDKMREVVKRWGVRYLVVEEASSSKQLVQRLQRMKKIPLMPVKADRDKGSRAALAQMWIRSGFVHFPAEADWLMDFEKELLSFPNVINDDQTDMLAYSVNFVNGRDLWEAPSAVVNNFERARKNPFVFMPTDLYKTKKRSCVFSTDHERQ